MEDSPIQLDERQERIHKRLERLVGPGAAAFFTDACRIMEASPPFEAQTHLVAHCLREIESAMRRVMTTVSSYKEDEGRCGGGSHKANVEAILEAFDEPDDGALREQWMRLLDFKLHKHAHRRSLRPARPVDDQYHSFWESAQQVLDEALLRFEQAFAAVTDELDRLLDIKQPTKQDAKIVAEEIPFSPVAHCYFFERLKHPQWIPPLRKKGLFASPPPAQIDSETGGISFPSWPASRLLKRMAADAPQVVFDAMACVPQTDNQLVYGDLAKAASDLPPTLAAKWTEHGIEWVKKQDHLYFNLPDDFAALAAHLAANGEADAASRMTHALLDVQPEEAHEPDSLSTSELDLLTASGFPEPRTRFAQDFYYERVLDRVTSALVEAAHEKALRLLCELLVKCIELSLAPDEKDEAPPYDASNIWLESVAPSEDGETLRHRPKGWLAEALRKAALQVVEEEPSQMPTVVELLESQAYAVFQRIALYLLRVADDAPVELIDERLLEREQFSGNYFWPEYAALLRERFTHLSSEDQKVVLGWIEEGPDAAKYRRVLKEGRGEESEQAEVQAYVRAWRRQRAQALEEVLPERWKEAHVPLFETESASAETSPAQVSIRQTMSQVEKLLEEDLEALGALLRRWPDLEAAPNREGVGILIQRAAKQSPKRFAEAATSFEGTDATFVKGFVKGLREAAESDASFPWGPVLVLGRWAVAQPHAIEGRSYEKWLMGERDGDPHWGWARNALAELLGQGVSVRSGSGIDFDHSEEVWQALEPLASDPDPTPERDKKHSTDRPFDYALNTTRGKAMIAVMKYVGWKWQCLNKQRSLESGAEHSPTEAGLADIPEAEELLSKRLDPSVDSSPAIRAVYGRYFPMLAHIDEEWARRNLPRIFPEAPEHRALFEAAWTSYLSTGTHEVAAFNVAREVYERAVGELGSGSHKEGGLGILPQLRKQDRKLAERLMRLYVWGHLELEGELLVQFFDVASDELRGHALRHVGELLAQRVAPKHHPDSFERCRALWEKRLHWSEGRPADSSAKHELGAFGSWFTSGKVGLGDFSEDWAVQQLHTALELGGEPDRPHRVIEVLGDIPPPSERVVRCIELLLLRDLQAGARLARYKQTELHALFRDALKVEPTTAETTRELIGRLLSIGVDHFKDLL